MAIALCSAGQLLEGQARGFDPHGAGSDTVFALRHAGMVRVYRNSCPHLDVPLQYRKDRYLSADGQRIICYAHGAQFAPHSGECLHGPCRGLHLEALAHRIEDGWLVLEQF